MPNQVRTAERYVVINYGKPDNNKESQLTVLLAEKDYQSH